MPEEVELVAAEGFVAAELKAEFPSLRLDWVTTDARPGPSPRELTRRLRELSSRYRGANVIAMRTQPIPSAYRTFFRQIGLDPDVDRVPSERVAVQRLRDGGFIARNLIDDACLIALIETGVPVWALDADLVDAGGLGIRLSADGERLGSTELGRYLPAGLMVVGDSRGVHAVLFEEQVAPGHRPSSRTHRVVLFTVGVDGVPAIHIEEALWVCLEAILAR